MCISPHLSVILALFSIPFSLYLILSLALVSTLLTPSPCYPPIPPFACYQDFWFILGWLVVTHYFHSLICAWVDYGYAVYIGLSSTNASKRGGAVVEW